MTSIEQATHYINKPQPKVSHSRKVVLSSFLNVQLHVLLVGENEDEIEDEAYELWEEEMADDDDDDDNDNDNNEEEGQEQELVKQVQEEIMNTDDQQSQVNQVKNNPIVAKNNNECEVQQETITHNTVNNNADLSRVTDVPDPNSKVLRVFAGNVDVGASYHSLRVNESTSVAELLFNAMEKFHISQIETKHGHHHGNSCVEYYLTVKTRDGDEITLDASDKPFAIYESLTTHLTTPMPSLTQFRQLTSTNSVSKQQKKKKRSSISGDSSLQFFMHKRIKRVNDKSGQIHIKVSLMTSVTPSLPEKMNAIKKMTSLRFNKKKSKKETVELERIDKLIAIPASITIADLTSTALVKFHIISDKDQPHQYRLLLNANGKGKKRVYILYSFTVYTNHHHLCFILDKLLNATQHLSEVISDLGKSDKRFVLHNFNSSLDEHPQRPLSLSSSTSSSSSSSAAPNNRPTSSKVFPEIFPHRNPYSHSNHPVMTRLDSNTEAILKRVDAALESFEKSNNNPSRPKKNSFPSPMSVSRNESGVDIHLPHGLLRSTVLSDRKTQYSLMTAPNTLVLQKVLPADNKRSLLNTNSTSISGEELATLIKYGSQYLDTYDTANKPTLLSATSRLIVERDNEKSPSGLEDLEKVKLDYYYCIFTNYIFYNRNFNVLLPLIPPRKKNIHYILLHFLFYKSTLFIIYQIPPIPFFTAHTNHSFFYSTHTHIYHYYLLLLLLLFILLKTKKNLSPCHFLKVLQKKQ